MANDPQRLKLALNSALNQQAILNSNFRMHFARGLGADDKRKYAWQEYGWKENLDFDDFYNLYDRQGVAYGVVNLLNDKCFETNPWVIEGDETDEKRPETPWEKSVRLFAKKSKLWKAFKTADEYRLVGEGWSGIILQIADGGKWTDPVTLPRAVIKSLIPAWQGQLTPTDVDTDENSATFGEPQYWQFTEGAVCSSTDSTVTPRNIKIHPDRIIIIGDWRGGRSFLRAGYNAFVNLEKIEGGSGESFLKNAGRQMAINYEKEVDLSQIARNYKLKDVSELQELFNEQARDLNNGGDRLMITQGASTQMLVSTVPDPTPHYDTSIQTVAASTQMPAKVVVGMQTGERASTEDLKQFNKRGQGRRVNTLSDDSDQIINHLIRVKLIEPAPGGEFTTMWDDLTESTFAEKLAFAKTMAEVNSLNAGNGDGPVYASGELREVSGFENDAESDAARAADFQDVEPEPIVPAPAQPGAVA
ncbi:hypothetical protein D3C77_48750 [compost metagenome]